MSHYRNFLTFLADQHLAVDLRPLTVLVGSADPRKSALLAQLHGLSEGFSAELEIHNLLHQFQLHGEVPGQLAPLISGHLYDSAQLGGYQQIRCPASSFEIPQDPGLAGESLFSFFSSLGLDQQRLIMGHLKHVLGPVSIDLEPVPRYWREGATEYSLETLPTNRLALLWLLCGLYDEHPLKIFVRPERALGRLPRMLTEALVLAFRQASANGQVIIETYHAGLISALDPNEIMLVKSQQRQGVWASDIDPSLTSDKARFLRYAMELAA